MQGNGGNGGAGDGEGDLPAWCDHTDPMGAWMNYVKVELVSQYRENAYIDTFSFVNYFLIFKFVTTKYF